MARSVGRVINERGKEAEETTDVLTVSSFFEVGALKRYARKKGRKEGEQRRRKRKRRRRRVLAYRRTGKPQREGKKKKTRAHCCLLVLPFGHVHKG